MILRHRGEPFHFDELAGPLRTGTDQASPAADAEALKFDAVTAAHIRRVLGMTGGKIHGPGRRGRAAGSQPQHASSPDEEARHPVSQTPASGEKVSSVSVLRERAPGLLCETFASPRRPSISFQGLELAS